MKSDPSEFVARYGGIYERSPWVAEDAAALVGADESVHRIAEVMAACVDNAPLERQLELIRAHPDLAGKVQVTGGLTADSAREQASAGLDRCSAEEFERFQRLNRAYREKFGFPFVMAVRDKTRAEILDAFEKRLGQGKEAEFRSALTEIHKIARLRLRAMERK
jgi:OHCU decarboxylase